MVQSYLRNPETDEPIYSGGLSCYDIYMRILLDLTAETVRAIESLAARNGLPCGMLARNPKLARRLGAPQL
jgi:hypothetical protein